MSEEHEAFARRFRVAVKTSGMSLGRIAELCGVSGHTIRRAYQTDNTWMMKKGPRLCDAIKYADVLGVDRAWLCWGEWPSDDKIVVLPNGDKVKLLRRTQDHS